MRGRKPVAGQAATHHARRTFATALLMLALLAAPPAVAQLLPPVAAPDAPPAAPVLNFSQQGVPAEATAENAVLARERALASGRRTAWERLTSEAGLPDGVALSDAQIEEMVRSIVIEQERITPTRYAGRITVNFNPERVRSVLAGRIPGLAAPEPATPPRFTGPASNWLEAVATYRSMGEWLELRRRLSAASPVASVRVEAIAVDQARLRLGLRAPPPVAAEELAVLGVALAPAVQAGPGETWHMGLAGGY